LAKLYGKYKHRQLFSQVSYTNNNTQNSASAETALLSNINQKLKYKKPLNQQNKKSEIPFAADCISL
jgi:hypothetical protein